MPAWIIDETRMAQSWWQPSAETIARLILATNKNFTVLTSQADMDHIIVVKCENKPEDSELFNVYWSELVERKEG